MSTDALFQPIEGPECAGLEIHVVGGAVRDRLLGVTPHDMDYVVVGATPETMRSRGCLQVGQDFPVFLHPRTHVELALARTERKTQAGHTGFQVHADPSVSLEADLLRRDFTINAMAIDQQGQITDPYGGQQDLENRALRHVSDAFREDPLRILRGVRFLAKLAPFGFKLAPETEALMREMSPTLGELSVERIMQELDRTLQTDHPLAGLTQLNTLGVTDVLAPECTALPDAFQTSDLETRWVEWVLCNQPTNACFDRYRAHFKLSTQRSTLCRAAMCLKSVTKRDAKELLDTMQLLGWLRGNPPDATVDQALRVLDSTGFSPIPVAEWMAYRGRVRQVTAQSPKVAGLSGKALGDAIYAERLRVLSMEISAPGTAPGL
jgi:tRNA nucleotidyltransferase/poly(A) polymerase